MSRARKNPPPGREQRREGAAGAAANRFAMDCSRLRTLINRYVSTRGPAALFAASTLPLIQGASANPDTDLQAASLNVEACSPPPPVFHPPHVGRQLPLYATGWNRLFAAFLLSRELRWLQIPKERSKAGLSLFVKC